jgi:hypothetical protein
MARKLTPEQENTLRALRDRAVLTLRFFESTQDFSVGARMREDVEKYAAAGNLRAVRSMAHELDAMTIALAPHERDGLEALLKDRLGIDKDHERELLRKRFSIAIKRGTIASEAERQHLEDYRAMLEATDGDPDEIAAVERLLAT